MAQKLKVPRDVLLARAEEMEAELRSRQDAAGPAHDEALRKWALNSAEQLRAAADRIVGDPEAFTIGHGYDRRNDKYGDHIDVPCDDHPHVEKPLDRDLERDLRLLRASTDAVISIEPGDRWSRYLP